MKDYSYATKEDVEAVISKALSKTVDEISDVVASLAQGVHNEIIELKSANTETRLSIDRLTNTIDGFIKRLDEIETEQTSRDAQFEKLIAWAKEVSAKTGIPLKGL